ncbi:MAG: response regulator [Bacilli bacterium]|nr:response regulator [Bacilli bacterium]
MAKRLLVVDSNIQNGEAVWKYFKNSSSIEVVNVVSSKEEAVRYLREVDVIVVDLLLNGLDSMMIFSSIKEQCLNKKVIATSEFVTNDMINSLNEYNINYFIKKPYTPESLERVINSLYIANDTVKKMEIVNSEESDEAVIKVTNMLHSLGIPSHIKGYNYIRDGILKILNNSHLVGSITKELYPEIAGSYNTTASRVERAIRHAIEVSWVRGDYHKMEELFGNSVDVDRSKPTNAEFIVTLADRLKIDSKYV